jgi:hypothetical protein
MKKFLINTPGRTASTSLFNFIEASLKEHTEYVATIDRGSYSDTEIEMFNLSKYAAFTMFNPFKFPFIVADIDPAEWCLVVLTRHNFADWLLSMITIHSTGEWHPGKQHKAEMFYVKQEELLTTYWYYKCWTNQIEKKADTFGFGEVIRLDFDNLIKDWKAAGKLIGDWDWNIDPKLMKLGMTSSWSCIDNIDEVINWLPQDDVILIDNIKKSL